MKKTITPHKKNNITNVKKMWQHENNNTNVRRTTITK
jgi:hypothetical protein